MTPAVAQACLPVWWLLSVSLFPSFFPSVQRPLAHIFKPPPSLLPSPQQVKEPSPPRMTSAAPAKKPYRKAPPEHRELRLEVPGLRLEQEVSKTGTLPWLAEVGP